MFSRLLIVAFYRLLTMWVCLSCITFSAHAVSTEYRFDRLWPKLDLSLYFNGLSSMAIAEDGSLYVCEGKNVKHFNKDGTLNKVWPGQYCAYIVVGSNSDVYVVNATGDGFVNKFRLYMSSGVFLSKRVKRVGQQAFAAPFEVVTNSKNAKYSGSFCCDKPRCGLSHERSSDHKPSIVLT